MKIEITVSGILQVMVLSRKNLEVLLEKLDGHPPNSACTIMGGLDAPGWLVRAEENDVHYLDREAGFMHPDTEDAVSSRQKGE
jgi:hypothetical protein